MAVSYHTPPFPRKPKNEPAAATSCGPPVWRAAILAAHWDNGRLARCDLGEGYFSKIIVPMIGPKL